MSQKKKKPAEQAYEFFLRAEQEQRYITSADITAATGYAVGTVRTYITKKWSAFLIPTAPGFYAVQGIHKHTVQEFTEILRSVSPPQKLILHLPYPLAVWLYSLSIQKGCHMRDVVIEVLEQQRQSS